jgi:hypothetical protein
MLICTNCRFRNIMGEMLISIYARNQADPGLTIFFATGRTPEVGFCRRGAAAVR